MRCPTLKELPPPPPGKTGWPWTEESPQLPDTMPNGRPWPKVSIVTPNYNYGRFIEETIRSVLLQGYPNLEYIIIDGGSTDNSIEIIKKYKHWLAYCTSKPDKGIYNAINKGLRIATGSIVGIINSDDIYTRETLKAIMFKFIALPNTKIVSGGATIFRETSGKRKKHIGKYLRSKYIELTLKNAVFGAPLINARFIKKQVYQKIGFFNENYKLASDRDFIIRIALHKIPNALIPKIVYHYRSHPSSSTINKQSSNTDLLFREDLKICESYLLNENLSGIMKLWHGRETAKAAFFHLRNGNVTKALMYIKRGQEINARWPIILVNLIVHKIRLTLSFSERALYNEELYYHIPTRLGISRKELQDINHIL